MKYAILSLSYNLHLAVPVANLSKILTMLQDCTRVDSTYMSGQGDVYYLSDRVPPPTVTLIDAILPAKPTPADE